MVEKKVISSNKSFTISLKKLTSPNFAKKATGIGFGSYFFSLIVAMIIAFYFGTCEYSLFFNWVGELGSSSCTPIPYLHDITSAAAGLLTIPFYFYLEKILAPFPKNEKQLKRYSKLQQAIATYALLSCIIGNVGLIGTGIFSTERNLLDLHFLFGSLAFCGHLVGATLIGIIILFYNVDIPKILGLYGTLGPLSAFIIFLLGYYARYLLTPFFEWMLLFSLLLFLITLATIVFYEDL
ncbi:MAG: hypothetical protein ACTSYC_00875 [Promethearchaeota archaeon]